MPTISKNIYLDAPSLGVAEKKYLVRAIDSGYVSSAGGFVNEFEDRFSRYVGAKKSVSTQSGTSALHMALYELGIGKGDEVIVPATTFIASVNPVVYVGAKPVFADIDEQTWNIDPEQVERLLNKRTKAIIPVHLYGNPCDMDSIMKVAGRYHLHVIEDATESLGAKYKKRHTGTFGDFGCFSFNGNKLITTGGGGMIVGRNTKKMEHIRFLVNQAKDKTNSLYHPEIGFNYRMTNIEAALGLAQFEKIGIFLDKKKEVNSIYRKELSDIDSICFQDEYDSALSSHWLTCIKFTEKIDVTWLQKKLRKYKIQTRRIFMPVIGFPPYRNHPKNTCNMAYKLYKSGLCLPSSVLNTKDDIYFVARKIKELVSK